MGGKHHRGLAVILHVQKARDVVGRVVDMGAAIGVAGTDVVEMRDLGADPAEIVPHAAQNRFDLGVGLFRKSRAQIGAAGAVLGQPRPDPAHEGAGKIADRDAVAPVDAGQHARRRPSGDLIRSFL